MSLSLKTLINIFLLLLREKCFIQNILITLLQQILNNRLLLIFIKKKKRISVTFTTFYTALYNKS